MDEQVSSQRASLQGEAEALGSTVAQADVIQEHALWTSFAEASTVEAFCQSWLALQCRMMGRVRAGMALLGPNDRGPFRPVATWPEGRRNLKHLTKTAERTLTDHRGLVVHGEPAEGETHNGHYEIGYPIEARGALHGTTVLEVTPKSEATLQGMIGNFTGERLGWNCCFPVKPWRRKRRPARTFRRRSIWWPRPSVRTGFMPRRWRW